MDAAFIDFIRPLLDTSLQCGLSIEVTSFNNNTNVIGLKELHQAYIGTYIQSIIQHPSVSKRAPPTSLSSPLGGLNVVSCLFPQYC